MWPLLTGSASSFTAIERNALGLLPIIDARIYQNAPDILPPCPLNVHSADWDALLDDLCANLTLDTWCDAVLSGFAKTAMGKSTSWLWHDTLMDKYSLADLPDTDYRLLLNMLERLWNEDEPMLWQVDEHEPLSLAMDNLRLLNSMSESNVLGAFLLERRNLADGTIWSASRRITNLTKRLEQDLLLTHERHYLWDKVDYFLVQLDQSVFPRHLDERSVRITETIYQQLRDHLWQHMKMIQREQPECSTKEFLKTWDEQAAVASIRFEPLQVDFLSRFCAHAETADYG